MPISNPILSKLSNKLTIANNTTDNSLVIAPTGNSGLSSSTGGAINVDMTGGTGAGVVLYSNRATNTGPLLSVRTNQSTFDQHAIFVDYKGNTNAVNIKFTTPSGSNVSTSAFNMTSDNENGSAIQLRGREKALGSFKVTHENPSITDGVYDLNAAAISVDVTENINSTGIGTAAQGVVVNSTTGTTGKLFRARNLGVDYWAVEADGRSNFFNNRAINLANPTSNQDAATKFYVDNQGSWTPTNYSFISWAYDIAYILNQTAPTTGIGQLIKLRIPVATTITNILIGINTAGVGLANCYVALFQNDILLGQSANQSANWQSTGMKKIPLSSPQVVNAGTVDVMFWVGSATITPSFGRAGGIATIAGGLTGSNLRWATHSTGLTTTAPSTITSGGRTSGTIAYWAAVS